MEKSQGKRSQQAKQRPRDAEGRFESASQAKQDGMNKTKSPQHQSHGNPNQPRDADGRFEKK